MKEAKDGLIKIRRRVGFKLEGKGIVREGCKIFDKAGNEVGLTTSGVYSPCLQKCVGMAYVDDNLKGIGNELDV